MISLAMALLGVAAVLMVVRLILGPTVADRVVAADGLLVTAMCGALLAAADSGSNIGIDTVLVVALLSFVATGVMARYIEQRGSR
ncbi:MAG: monovalent cation/H+ antiporter complex subunit F [Ilumatobacteraceae bacterium]